MGTVVRPHFWEDLGFREVSGFTWLWASERGKRAGFFEVEDIRVEDQWRRKPQTQGSPSPSTLTAC